LKSELQMYWISGLKLTLQKLPTKSSFEFLHTLFKMCKDMVQQCSTRQKFLNAGMLSFAFAVYFLITMLQAEILLEQLQIWKDLSIKLVVDFGEVILVIGFKLGRASDIFFRTVKIYSIGLDGATNQHGNQVSNFLYITECIY
jgi:hypothetical protein